MYLDSWVVEIKLNGNRCFITKFHGNTNQTYTGPENEIQ